MSDAPTEGQVQLETIRRALHLYYFALSGENPVISGYRETATVHLGARGVIRVPEIERPYWYRIALAHRAMHRDVGTMSYRLHRSGSAVEEPYRDGTLEALQHDEGDLVVALGRFEDWQLAVQCFVLLEDLRVDTALKRQYPGLRADLSRVQSEELSRRGPLGRRSARAALMEVLARVSLGWSGVVEVPSSLGPALRELINTAASITASTATVEDVVDATARAYALITQPREAVTSIGSDLAASEIAVILSKEWQGTLISSPLEPIRYRDQLGDRLLRSREGPALAVEASFDDVLQASVLGQEPLHLAEPSRPGFLTLDDQCSFPVEEETESGELEPDVAQDLISFVYPEWDYKTSRYRNNWCRVVETVAPSSTDSADFYRFIVRTRRGLVAEIRRQFERITPETLHRIRRVQEGEELDIDACIEAYADLRAGIPPSDNLYQTRQRVERDVAVIFLVDLSNSTMEPIVSGGEVQRIIDVIRESLALLVAPLARLGDLFGIYGFSGTNRRDVRFIVVKDINEPLRNHVIARLGALRSYQTTRMGAAIRHASTKLKGQAATTRLLILISDGRPYDADYGQEYGRGEEVEYAINDTRTALDEARAEGIRPFLITVDPQGDDYLRRMCSGLDYELLDSIPELPARLARLYRELAPEPRRKSA